MTSGFETTTVVGGVTYIGEIRHTRKDNKPILNLSVAVSKDRYVPEDNHWEQGGAGTYYESVTIFGPAAEKAKATFAKGDLVIVVGERNPKPEWTDKNGEKHEHESQITAKYIGVGLLFNDVQIDRNKRKSDSAPSAPARKASAPAVEPKVEDDSYDDPLGDDETEDW